MDFLSVVEHRLKKIVEFFIFYFFYAVIINRNFESVISELLSACDEDGISQKHHREHRCQWFLWSVWSDGMKCTSRMDHFILLLCILEFDSPSRHSPSLYQRNSPFVFQGRNKIVCIVSWSALFNTLSTIMSQSIRQHKTVPALTS